jgi:diaminopimelate epimerase
LEIAAKDKATRTAEKRAQAFRDLNSRINSAGLGGVLVVTQQPDSKGEQVLLVSVDGSPTHNAGQGVRRTAELVGLVLDAVKVKAAQDSAETAEPPKALRRVAK